MNKNIMTEIHATAVSVKHIYLHNFCNISSLEGIMANKMAELPTRVGSSRRD
jgi:hypothetical protein